MRSISRSFIRILYLNGIRIPVVYNKPVVLKEDIEKYAIFFIIHLYIRKTKWATESKKVQKEITLLHLILSCTHILISLYTKYERHITFIRYYKNKVLNSFLLRLYFSTRVSKIKYCLLIFILNVYFLILIRRHHLYFSKTFKRFYFKISLYFFLIQLSFLHKLIEWPFF